MKHANQGNTTPSIRFYPKNQDEPVMQSLQAWHPRA